MQRFTLVTCLAAAVLLATNAEAADAKKIKASKLFEQGIADIEAKAYQAALAALEEAYLLVPHWKVLAHIGNCQIKLGHPVEAIATLEKYLEEGGADISEEDRKVARNLLLEQRQRVGTLNIHVRTDGAKVEIDRAQKGTTPLRGIILLAGPHHVVVREGKAVHERDVKITAEQETSLWIPAEDEPKAGAAMAPVVEQPSAPESTPTTGEFTTTPPPAGLVPASTPPPTAAPRRIGPSAPFYVALSLAGAGFVTGGVSFGLRSYYTTSENNFAKALANLTDPTDPTVEHSGPFSYKNCRDSLKTDPNGNSFYEVDTAQEAYYCGTEVERRNYRDKANRALVPAIVGTAVFVAAGVTAIVFLLNQEWFNKHGEQAVVSLLPYGDPRGAGLMLSGSFR